MISRYHNMSKLFLKPQIAALQSDTCQTTGQQNGPNGWQMLAWISLHLRFPRGVINRRWPKSFWTQLDKCKTRQSNEMCDVALSYTCKVLCLVWFQAAKRWEIGNAVTESWFQFHQQCLVWLFDLGFVSLMSCTGQTCRLEAMAN